jgi:hypothetical protein
MQSDKPVLLKIGHGSEATINPVKYWFERIGEKI